MRFGSVASGIEAASVAFSSVGWDAAWFAEVDVPASQVLAHHYGATAPTFPLGGTEKGTDRLKWGDTIINWGDMTNLPALIKAGEAEAPDVLCGGTPCQGFSIAGRRGGLSDPRGALTMSFVEIADAIDEVRPDPCIIFWENVPGVLSDKGNAFGNFISALAGDTTAMEPGSRPVDGRSSAHWTWKKETCQHVPKWPHAGVAVGPKRTVAWIVKDAQYFGLAQRRSRVYVVASAIDGFDPAKVLFEFEGLRRDIAPSRGTGSLASALTANGVGAGGGPDDNSAQANHIVPASRNSMASGGVGFRMVAFGEYADDNVGSSMKARDHKDATDLVVAVSIRGRDGGGTAELGGEVSCALRASSGGGDKQHVLVAFSAKDYGGDCTNNMAPTLHAMGSNASHANGGGKLAVCVVHGTQDPCVSDTLAFALGRNNGAENAVFSAKPMNSSNQPPLARGPVPGARTGMSVRRLLPVECERLQGFPDDYTLVPVGNKPAYDGQRYKQLGNTWPVPVVKFFGRRIDEQLRSIRAKVDQWITVP